MIGINPAILVQNLGIMGNILQTVSIMMGLSFVLSSMFKFKKFAETRSLMSHHQSMAAPLLMLLCGVMLLTLPFTLRSALLNFWSSTTPMRYSSGGNNDLNALIPSIVIFVRLIGVGAFIRGIVLFSRAGGEQAQRGTISKALLHILGGLLCVNIIGTFHLVQSILGIIYSGGRR